MLLNDLLNKRDQSQNYRKLLLALFMVISKKLVTRFVALASFFGTLQYSEDNVPSQRAHLPHLHIPHLHLPHLHVPHIPIRPRPVITASAVAFFLIMIGSITSPSEAYAATIDPASVAAGKIYTQIHEHPQRLVIPKTATIPSVARDNITASSSVEAQQNVLNSVASEGTNVAWAKLVLMYGGWPVSDNNVTVMTRWMRQENGTNDWWNRNNPLNNGYGAPGAGGTGSNPNLESAAQKVAAALHSGIGGGYGSIVANLAASSSPDVTAAAIWVSGWSSSHYANGTHWSSAPVNVVVAPAGAW